MKYTAFISYRHSVASRLRAERLENSLRRYAKPIWRAPIAIFRDERILKPGDDLPRRLREALASSEFLLYLASRESAESEWISEELRIWCDELRRTNKLILVHIDGRIAVDPVANTIVWSATNAIPPILSRHLNNIPLWVDLTWIQKEEQLDLSNTGYKKQINAVVALFRGLEPGEMNDSEVLTHRRNLLTRNLGAAAVSIFAVLALIFGASARHSAALAESSRQEALREAHVAADARDDATKAADTARGERDRATRQERIAEEQRTAALEQRDRAIAEELIEAGSQFQVQDPARALYLGYRAAQIARSTPEGLQEMLAGALSSGPAFGILRGHKGSVADLKWSPDGKTIASAGDDGTLRLWDLGTGNEIRNLKVSDRMVRSVVWSSDGQKVAAISDATIRIWDAAAGQELRMLRLPEGASADKLVWMEDERLMASAGEVGFAKTTEIWAVDSGRLLAVEPWPVAVLSPDGKLIASVTGDHSASIQISDAASYRPLRSLESPGQLLSLAWSPDGKRLAFAGSAEPGQDFFLLIRDSESGRLVQTVRPDGEAGRPGHLEWSPDGGSIALETGGFKVWVFRRDEGADGKGTTTYINAAQEGADFAWSPDSRSLATAASDYRVQLWNTRDHVYGGLLRTLPGHVNHVTNLAWRPDGAILASAGFDGTIRLYDTPGGQPLRSLAGSRTAVTGLAWSPSGRLLASASEDQTVLLWDLSTGHNQTLQGPVGYIPGVDINKVVWSPDGAKLALITPYRVIKAWQLSDRRQIGEITGHLAVWSPDGERLASAYLRTIQLWNVQSGSLISYKTLDPGETVFSLSWSADGKALVALSTGKAITRWDAASGNLLQMTHSKADLRTGSADPKSRTVASSADARSIALSDLGSAPKSRQLFGDFADVSEIEWSPNGHTIAAATGTSILLWDAVSRKPLRTLTGHQGRVTGIAWSPDGKTLASGGADKTIDLWPGTAEGLLDEVRDRIRLYRLPDSECQRFGLGQCPPSSQLARRGER